MMGSPEILTEKLDDGSQLVVALQLMQSLHNCGFKGTLTEAEIVDVAEKHGLELDRSSDGKTIVNIPFIFFKNMVSKILLLFRVINYLGEINAGHLTMFMNINFLCCQ